MEPVTGPIVTSLNSGSGTEAYDVRGSKTVFRQLKPYDRPLPYKLELARIDNVRGFDSSNPPLRRWWATTSLDVANATYGGATDVPQYGSGRFPELERIVDRRLNIARQKFAAQINRRVSLSVDLLQRKQAYAMLISRTFQVVKVLKSIKRGRVREALRLLGVRKPAGWRSAIRDAGSLWLEYSYGWKPLINDISEAALVLSSPFDNLWFYSSSSERYDPTFTYRSNPEWDDEIELQQKLNLKVFARVGGVVSCDNPNLQAAKNAGLTNPAAWAWELIPWSFVVDWFINVGDFIESLDEWVGLTITNGYYTYGYKGTAQVNFRLVQSYSRGESYLNGSTASKTRVVSYMTRELGLPAVRIVRNERVLTNVSRGLNAAALLTQSLRGR